MQTETWQEMLVRATRAGIPPGDGLGSRALYTTRGA
jgi:hypothetical protein